MEQTSGEGTSVASTQPSFARSRTSIVLGLGRQLRLGQALEGGGPLVSSGLVESVRAMCPVITQTMREGKSYKKFADVDGVR